jgi:hypothetical protein
MKRISHNTYTGDRKEEIYIFVYNGETLLEVVDICTAPCIGETVLIDAISYTVDNVTTDPVAITVICDLVR